MGQIWFVGAGLSDERDLSERALEILRSCDRVFAEEYTSVLAPGSLDRLARAIGRPVERLDRSAIESEETILSALSQFPRIAFVVVGDPFSATTHVALRLACERAGHSWKYLPNASIVTAAAGFLGLQQYRFGRVTSIPFPEPGFSPRSPLEMIERNSAANLHTLVLLDLRPTDGRFLTADQALRWLAERDRDGATVGPARPIAVVARVGTDSASAWFGPRSVLERLDFGAPMHSLVVPAMELHFEEAEALRRIEVSGDRGPTIRR